MKLFVVVVCIHDLSDSKLCENFAQSILKSLSVFSGKMKDGKVCCCCPAPFSLPFLTSMQTNSMTNMSSWYACAFIRTLDSPRHATTQLRGLITVLHNCHTHWNCLHSKYSFFSRENISWK